ALVKCFFMECAVRSVYEIGAKVLDFRLPGDQNNTAPIYGNASSCPNQREKHVMLRHAAAWTLLLFTLLTPPLFADDKSRSVGATEKGFVLPNGWTISPAGQ